jgi:hypothetical protein
LPAPEREMSWDEVGFRVHELLREGRDDEAWAAIDEAALTLETRWPPPASGFREAGRELYWTHRAVPEYVRLQQEQIRRIEAEADPDLPRLTGALYDLASFAWPGWGLEVSPDDARLGAEAADRCLLLRTCVEGEFTISEGMAHWVAGAHALADGRLHTARAELAQSGDETLSRGYLGVVDLVERGDRSQLDGVLGELDGAGDEDSRFYRDQLVKAAEVFA